MEKDKRAAPGDVGHHIVYGKIVYIDTLNGTAGSVLGVNGTIENPVNNNRDAEKIRDLLIPFMGSVEIVIHQQEEGKMEDDKKECTTVLRTKRPTIKALKDEVAVLRDALLLVKEDIRYREEDIENQHRTITKLREVSKNQESMLEEFRAIEFNRLKGAPVNACAAEKEPSSWNESAIPETRPDPLYRIITNGKKYMVDASANNGKSWMPEQELRRCGGSGGRVVGLVRRSTYWGAKRYVKKTYGTRAILLDKEWRPV